ncbi:hypothetical protein [Parvicella tangerina]|uniref:Uncharacterized protein n=1 Tax=Parvicella tangerina TaxID=2829795 RepID=A0A916NIP1_9FLAO|nr:hypothetical protein [Parvicella tangerina]CAG5085559.1 hypothetical protein CRYO30217_02796 [Parvicella tangerina]
MKIEFSKRIIGQFLVTVLLVLVVVCVLHLLILSGASEVPELVIFISYLSQLLLSVASFFLLARVSVKKGEHAGFFFLGFSLVKFLVYVLGFRFYFLKDGLVSKEEYAVFFIPYITAFVVEIVYLVHVLNKVPMDPDYVIVYKEDDEEE